MGQSGLGRRMGIFLGMFALVGGLAGAPCRADDGASKKTKKTAQAADTRPAKSDSDTDSNAEINDAVRKQARESYALGQKAFLENNFEAAEGYFRQAHDLLPHPSTLKMIAECYVALGEIAAAVTIMEALLEDEQYQNRAPLQKRIATLRKQVGVLEITTIPEGGRIEVNNISLAEWGHAVVNVDPGRVTVVVTNQGTRVSRDVRIAAGHREKLVIDSSEAIATGPGAESSAEGANEPGDGRIAHISPDTLGPESEELPRAFWAAGALVGLGLVSGTVFGTMALRDQKDYDDTPKKGTRDSGRSAAIIADISFGLALGAAVAGTIILISEKRKKKRGKQSSEGEAGMTLSPIVGRDGAGIAAGVTF